MEERLYYSSQKEIFQKPNIFYFNQKTIRGSIFLNLDNESFNNFVEDILYKNKSNQNVTLLESGQKRFKKESLPDDSEWYSNVTVGKYSSYVFLDHPTIAVIVKSNVRYNIKEHDKLIRHTNISVTVANFTEGEKPERHKRKYLKKNSGIDVLTKQIKNEFRTLLPKNNQPKGQ